MSDNITISRDDLDRLVKQAAAGGTSAAQLASPQIDPEPEFTFADTMRALVHYGRLPDEGMQRKCLAAIDKEYPHVSTDEAKPTVEIVSGNGG